jgi:hypothetical protein
MPNNPLTEATITAAQLTLAMELGIEPEELQYIGVQWCTGGLKLALFNILKPGHQLHRSTRSVRI